MTPNPDAAADAAARLHLQGDHAAARAAYLAVLQERPAHATVLNNLGFLELQAGDHAAAAQRFEQALAHDPARAMPHANLGLLHAQRGDWDQARAHLEQALERGPDDAGTWSSLAQVHAARGDPRSAAACWRQAAALQPTPRRLVQLGAARMALGELDAALAALHEALELDPADPDAWTHLGVALLVRQDLGSALDALQRAIAITPLAHDARHHLALVRLARGEPDEARVAWTRLLEAVPEHACRVDLAVLELSEGRLEAARALLEPAPPGARRDHYLAVARHRLGDPAGLAELQAQAAAEGAYARQSGAYLASLERAP
ncbi:MAG: hypothetical protein QOD77_274 [Thermoplasmata archaeon]|jgi:Tfp pilus assembly protein PilF|nr:hypothetical protein [Thermoplasmata archaeon]